MGRSSRGKKAPFSTEEGKYFSPEGALADNNGEFFKEDMER